MVMYFIVRRPLFNEKTKKAFRCVRPAFAFIYVPILPFVCPFSILTAYR